MLPGLGRAGGNKNTFNIDDVGYANASDVNMSVGGLNSSAYDHRNAGETTSHRWFGWNQYYPVTRIFNGSFDGGGGHQWKWSNNEPSHRLLLLLFHQIKVSSTATLNYQVILMELLKISLVLAAPIDMVWR